MGWSLSNTMTSEWCRDTLGKAMEILNTDQCSQFTADLFTEFALEKNIRISMDGRGRALGNIFIKWIGRSVMYAEVYHNAYQDGKECYTGLKGISLTTTTSAGTRAWTTTHRHKFIVGNPKGSTESKKTSPHESK